MQNVVYIYIYSCFDNTKDQKWKGVYIILHPIFSGQCLGLLPIHVGSFQLPPPPTLTLPTRLRSPPPMLPPPSSSLLLTKA